MYAAVRYFGSRWLVKFIMNEKPHRGVRNCMLMNFEQKESVYKQYIAIARTTEKKYSNNFISRLIIQLFFQFLFTNNFD